jgi:hypothetical protein
MKTKSLKKEIKAYRHEKIFYPRGLVESVL